MRLIALLYKEFQYHLSKVKKLFRRFVSNTLPNDGKKYADEITPTESPTIRPMKNFRWERKSIFQAILILFGLFILTIIGLILATYFGLFGTLPNKAELVNIQNSNASELYAENNVLLSKYFVENRSETSLAAIAPCVIHALIATEDARFMQHSGIDMRAIARVIGKTLLLQKESSGGGSTISQQLAKNLFPRKRYGLFSLPINKIKEIFIARRLEKVYSKEELLNLYLNTVSFSDNVFGIKVAADRFFSTTPDKLRAEQAALLIGTLKGTSLYDPLRHPERSEERRNVVLRQMQKYGYLEAEEAERLIALPIELKYNKVQNRNQGIYYKEHVRTEIEQILKNIKRLDGNPYNLYRDGLRIYTTINAKLQQYAEDAVTTHMVQLQKTFDKHWEGKKPWKDNDLLEAAIKKSDRYQKMIAYGASKAEIETVFRTPIRMKIFDWQQSDAIKEMSPLDSIKYYLSILHAGFLAADPNTGKIKAWVGGIDYRYFQYDHVKSQRQVGSTFKPIVYAEALKKGIPPCSYFQNTQVAYPEWGNWQPRNSDGNYEGFYSMAGGLSKSINTITVEVLFQTGIEPVRNLAKQLGVVSEIPKGPSIALGAVDASLYEMVNVYAAFANRGKHIQFYTIEKIEDRSGNVLYEAPKPKVVRVLPPENADMIVEMLRTVVNQGTASRLRTNFGLNGPLAGKTGTTQNQSDGWFIGFNSKLVAGAWVGAELPQIHFRSLSLGQGASTALPIWGHFMKKVYQNKGFDYIRNAAFPVLSEETITQLACDPYISDEVLDMDLLTEENQSKGGFFEHLFNKNKNLTFETDTSKIISKEHMERAQRNQEEQQRKVERQEKLKRFWSEKLFKGKNESEN